jgi:hypothetical protein
MRLATAFGFRTERDGFQCRGFWQFPRVTKGFDNVPLRRDFEGLIAGVRIAEHFNEVLGCEAALRIGKLLLRNTGVTAIYLLSSFG